MQGQGYLNCHEQCRDCIYHKYDPETGYHSCLEDVGDEETCNKYISKDDAMLAAKWED